MKRLIRIVRRFAEIVPPLRASGEGPPGGPARRLPLGLRRRLHRARPHEACAVRAAPHVQRDDRVGVGVVDVTSPATADCRGGGRRSPFSCGCCLVGVFAFALAEPRAVRTSDMLSVVYAIDMSDSIGESSTDSALQFLAQTVTQKPEKDQAGLVVFGRKRGRRAAAAAIVSVRLGVGLDQFAGRSRRDQHRAGPVARRGHAARGQPGTHRAHFRRYGDRRQPVAHSRRAQVAGNRRRCAADSVRLQQGGLARTARSAAVREDRRKLRGGDRALELAAGDRAARRP